MKQKQKYMKKSLITAMAVCAILLPSCTTTKKTASSLDIPTSISSASTADLKVDDERIYLTKYRPSKAIQRGGQKNALRAAVAELLKTKNADVLVAPQFEMTTSTNLFGKKTIKSISVSGHAGYYINIKPTQPKQTIILSDGTSGTCTDFQPMKKK